MAASALSAHIAGEIISSTRERRTDEFIGTHCSARHGDTFDQSLKCSVAHAVDLSVWHDVHGLGILYLSVMSGVMNLNVWACTNAPGTPSVSIFGMWQLMHSLPGVPAL